MLRIIAVSMLVVFGLLPASAEQAAGTAQEQPVLRMRRWKVDSEVMTSVGYHRRTQTMEIHFRSGEVYRYRPVSNALLDELLAAKSKGSFFRERVRGKIHFWRVKKPSKSGGKAAKTTN